MDPYPSQQHEGLQHAVYWLQQEVNQARFKPTSPKKSEVELGGGARVKLFDKNQVLSK